MAGYVLVNIAHHNRRPRAPRAALRVLGSFPNLDDLKMHVRNSLADDVDMHAAPLGKFFCLMRDPERDEAAHARAVQQLYLRRLREHEEEFRENVAAQRTGALSEPAAPGAPAAALLPAEPPSAVGRAAELRLQNFAVLSVMQDHGEPEAERQQPCVVVWGVYDTEEQAKAAIKKQLSQTVTDLHLEVVQLYEWLHPTEVEKHLQELPEEFRDEKLTELMQRRKDEARHVETFRQSCGDREAPLLDFSQPEVRRSGAEAPGELVAAGRVASLEE